MLKYKNTINEIGVEQSYVPHHTITSCAGGRHNMPPPLQVDLLTLKVVSESGVTWATSVPILVFLGLSVLDLGPCMRQTSDAYHRLMHMPYGSGGIISFFFPTDHHR